MAVETLVQTNLNYFIPPADGSKPWILNSPAKEGEATKNWSSKLFSANIENVRGKEDQYTLDKTGFQFHKSPSSFTAQDFDDEEKVTSEYYNEAIETYKRFTGASRVVIFDHTIRRNNPDTPNTISARKAVDQVHVDQSPEAAKVRVLRHLPPDEAPELLKHRYQIINLWRPIRHEAFDRPLAVCDYRSIDTKSDLVPTTLRYPDRDGEIFSVNYNPSHKWKYLKGMTPEEIILIKCADSIPDGSVAVCTPHTSFEDPTKPTDAKFRESIEIRALVFYD